MNTIIFDIDGTLADLTHRRHHVTGGRKDWDQFFDEMSDDLPLRDVCWLAELLGDRPWVARKLTLFIFSGRPDSHRDQTIEWLKKHVPNLLHSAEALLMRREHDHRPDTEVKREMLHSIQEKGHVVRLVVDDRPSVIQMWKDEGLTVLEHDSGEWDKIPRTWKPGPLNIMVGPSGAGKSKWVSDRFGSSDGVISSDELRFAITLDFTDQSANDQVFATLHALVKARVEGGLITVVDATNLHARDRRALRDLCPPDTEITYHVIDRPLADKHRDAGWRDEVVIKGEKLIDRHHNSFQSGIKHIMRGDDDPRVTVIDHRDK